MMKPLARSRLWDVGAALIAVLGAVKIAVVLPLQADRADFAHHYVWSRLLVQGANPYRVKLRPHYEKYGFVYDETTPAATYPPSLLWLFGPVALLGPRAACGCWVVVQAACLAAILLLTRRLLQGRLSARGWRFVCAAAVASTPVYLHFAYSQAQVPLALLVLAAYACHRAGRHAVATLAVTVAGLLKLYPFLLLPWFVWGGREGSKGRWGRAALAVGLCAAVVVLTGPQLWRDFFVYGWPVLERWAMHHLMNFSVPAVVAHLGYAAHGFSPSPVAERLWWATGVASGCAVLATAYWLCWRYRDDSEAQFCLLCAAMLAGHVAVWGHYIVFLIFPAAVAALRVVQQPSRLRIIWLALAVLAVNLVPTYWSGNMYAGIVWMSLPVCGTVALGVFFVREMTS
jgi:hypothetical protein